MATMTPEHILERHVHCNVTGLVNELVEANNPIGHQMMHGAPHLDKDTVYDAYEVWAVSAWLAKRLERRGYRVVECWYQHYWARGTSGQNVARDSVIVDIARDEKV